MQASEFMNSQNKQQPMRLSHPSSFQFPQRLRETNGAHQSIAKSFNTIDPSMLQSSQFIPSSNGRKKEMGSPDFGYHQDSLDFNDNTPSSIGPIPINRGQSSEYDLADDFSQRNSVNPSSPYATSPGNDSLYSPGPEDYGFDSNDLASYSHPGQNQMSTSMTSPIEIKNGFNQKMFRYNGQGLDPLAVSPNLHTSFQSMSLPSSSHEWFNNDNNFPNSLQYSEVGVFGNLMDSDEPDSVKQAQILYEKRRRRRESHNAVERRRRDNINEKIQELATLLPDNMLDSNNRPNKGSILRKSVDYIRQLQQQVEHLSAKNNENEVIIHELRKGSHSHSPIKME